MAHNYDQGYLDGLYSAYNAIETSEAVRVPGVLNVIDDLIQSALERVQKRRQSYDSGRFIQFNHWHGSWSWYLLVGNAR